GRPLNSPGNAPAIFVMDKKGNLYFHSNPEPGRFHHSSFLAGEDVLSAGQLKVKDGRVLYIDNISGHYKPGQVHAYQGLYKLLKEGVDFSQAKAKLINLADH
ncbi:MAG: hypothetical protein KC478_12460, partial [Bacteriovoracaceae bacterium]|nr:hypothetical protein [Bacteriovoracaceae bacterium]